MDVVRQILLLVLSDGILCMCDFAILRLASRQQSQGY